MTLFFSFDGRITRQQFWTGILSLLAVALVLRIVLGLSEPPRGVGLLATLPLLYVYGALLCKRLQDRNRDPMLWLPIYLLPILALGILRNMGFEESQLALPVETERVSGFIVQTPALLATCLAMAASAWAAYDLGMKKGSAGKNRFGQEPQTA